MKAIRTKKSLIYCAVVSVLLLAFGDAGFVLCYGYDGHIEIEDGTDAGCCVSLAEVESNRPNNHIHMSVPAVDSHCETCLDVAISLEVGPRRSGSDGGPGASIQQAGAALSSEIDASHVCDKLYSDPKGSPAQVPVPPHLLSSVVLLI